MTDGSWPEWFTLSAPAVCVIVATALSGTSAPRVGADVQHAERATVQLVLGQELHHDPVLVVGRVDRRDLPRAVRVVQRGLDLLAETPS